MNKTNPEEKTTKERQLNCILEIIDCILEETPYAVLKQYDPKYYKLRDELIVEFTLNRGTQDYKVAINWYGVIDSYSKKIPKHMLVDIHNGISDGYLKNILKELKEQNK